MPTRFYLHSSGSQPAPTNPAYDAGWEQTGAATRLPMDVKTQVAAVTALSSPSIAVTGGGTQQICGYQLTSRQVFMPVRLDASVLFSAVLRCSEDVVGVDAHLNYTLRAFSADGGTALATLTTNLGSTISEFPLHASQATRIIAQVAITAVTISEPWRLVLDLGMHGVTPATGDFQQRLGCSAASDFALTTALTTDLNPWMELSVNLDAVRLSNYHEIRMGCG